MGGGWCRRWWWVVLGGGLTKRVWASSIVMVTSSTPSICTVHQKSIHHSRGSVAESIPATKFRQSEHDGRHDGWGGGRLGGQHNNDTGNASDDGDGVVGGARMGVVRGEGRPYRLCRCPSRLQQQADTAHTKRGQRIQHTTDRFVAWRDEDRQHVHSSSAALSASTMQ